MKTLNINLGLESDENITLFVETTGDAQIMLTNRRGDSVTVELTYKEIGDLVNHLYEIKKVVGPSVMEKPTS